MSLKNWFRFITVGLIWGSTFLWIKIAVREIGPYTLVLYRTFFSILTLLYFAFRQRQRFTRTMLVPAAFLGLFNLIIPQVLISWGELHVPSWLASILVSAVPFFTALLALPWVPEERLTWRKVFGLLLGFVGVFVLVSGGLGRGERFNLAGSLAVVGAAFCFGISNVYTRVRAQHIDPESLTFWMMLPAMAVILPIAWVSEGTLVIPRLPLTWLAVLWLGALNGGLAMVFFYSLIQSVGPGRTSLVAYTYPLVGVLLGILFLQEKPGWELALGGILIVTGIMVFNRFKWREKDGRKSI